ADLLQELEVPRCRPRQAVASLVEDRIVGSRGLVGSRRILAHLANCLAALRQVTTPISSKRSVPSGGYDEGPVRLNTRRSLDRLRPGCRSPHRRCDQMIRPNTRSCPSARAVSLLGPPRRPGPLRSAASATRSPAFPECRPLSSPADSRTGT